MKYKLNEMLLAIKKEHITEIQVTGNLEIITLNEKA